MRPGGSLGGAAARVFSMRMQARARKQTAITMQHCWTGGPSQTSCLSRAAMPNTRNEKSVGEEIHHFWSPRARTASYWPAGQGAPLHAKVARASSVPPADAKAPRASRHAARRCILCARRTTRVPVSLLWAGDATQSRLGLSHVRAGIGTLALRCTFFFRIRTVCS